jgi:IS605 OrfB family transposase
MIRGMMLTFKYRVKDATVGKHLNRFAWASNQVWNYCCQIQRQTESRWKAGLTVRWPSAFDLIKLCTGSAAELGLHSDSVQTICRQFVGSRDLHKRCPRFRASGGAKRALGWIPFIPRALKIDGAHVVYLKRKFHFWKSREIAGEFKAGAFCQDARGRWYVTFQCEVADKLPPGTGEIGIDLGLETLAICSDGTSVLALKHYRRYEAALAVAQRANNTSRVKAIHAKIANARRHHLHEQSTRIARDNALIVVGNVSPTKLAKTRMAKSILDASWSMLRSQLRYKANRHGARYVEADERWTSQLCSDCGAVGGPKGIAQLGMRHWVCSDCGASHDRDVNAARNILHAGRERPPLAGEIFRL